MIQCLSSGTEPKRKKDPYLHGGGGCDRKSKRSQQPPISDPIRIMLCKKKENSSLEYPLNIMAHLIQLKKNTLVDLLQFAQQEASKEQLGFALFAWRKTLVQCKSAKSASIDGGLLSWFPCWAHLAWLDLRCSLRGAEVLKNLGDVEARLCD